MRRYASARDLQEATAIRTLCAERLDEIEFEGELRAAEAWQLREAVRTWDEFRAGRGRIVPRAAIDKAFADARSQRQKHRAAR